jgi:hypothetical protein
MSSAKLPRVFVGSSAEALGVAYALQESLDFDAEVTVWSQDLFRPSQATLHELTRVATQFDFAAFVMCPDDVVSMRGVKLDAVRDNVIFEFGLFVGALGLSRCFFVVPRDSGPIHLPSDLLGVTPLTYRQHRSDNNIVAALGPACNQMRKAFREASTIVTTKEVREMTQLPSLEDYVRTWDGSQLSDARSRIRMIPTDPYGEEFEGVKPAFKRVFAFLESLANAVLEKVVDEREARVKFGEAIESFWPTAASLLAPPNHRDDWWDPLPSMAVLSQRWSAEKGPVAV